MRGNNVFVYAIRPRAGHRGSKGAGRVEIANVRNSCWGAEQRKASKGHER